MWSVSGLPDLVATERRRLGWTVRDAASRTSEISNQTWGLYEQGKTKLTPRIQRGIAQAFGWPSDWPYRPGESTPVGPTYGEIAELPDRVGQLEARVAELERRLAVSEQATDRKPAPVVPLRSAADGGGERPSKSTGRRTNRPTGVPADDGGHVDG